MVHKPLIVAAVLATVSAAAPVRAQERPPGIPAGTLAESETSQFARQTLIGMARWLGSQERFSVAIRGSYDVVQPSGQKVEFAEARTVELQRPNQLRVSASESDGSGNFMLFDGNAITMMHAETNTYAQVQQPGDIDASIKHFVRDLKMRLPLAPVLLTSFAEEMSQRIRSVDYVEQTRVMGKPAHHIAVRTEASDFQVWIAEGKQPVPLRIVISYPQAEGHPQFRADFTAWNFAPKFGKKTFVFTPAADTSRIVFAVQVPALPSAEAAAGQPKQGEKP